MPKKRSAALTPEPAAPVSIGCSVFPNLHNMICSLTCFPPSDFAHISICALHSSLECGAAGALRPCIRGANGTLLDRRRYLPVSWAGWDASPYREASSTPLISFCPQRRDGAKGMQAEGEAAAAWNRPKGLCSTSGLALGAVGPSAPHHSQQPQPAAEWRPAWGGAQ